MGPHQAGVTRENWEDMGHQLPPRCEKPDGEHAQEWFTDRSGGVLEGFFQLHLSHACVKIKHT